MKILLSPAKKLTTDTPTHDTAECGIFMQDAETLHQTLKTQTPAQLSALMDISANLSQLNYDRNQVWDSAKHSTEGVPAIYAFQGDVYQGLQAADLSAEEVEYAQPRVRILSGLYGMLRPLDRIMPYRLEMGVAFGVDGHKDLYTYWRTKLTTHLKNELTTDEPILDLASKEYGQAIDHTQLEDHQIITPMFKDFKNGQYKIVSFWLKKARGYMTRHILKHRIENPHDLKNHTIEGYTYDPKLSEGNRWTFVR